MKRKEERDHILNPSQGTLPYHNQLQFPSGKFQNHPRKPVIPQQISDSTKT